MRQLVLRRSIQRLLPDSEELWFAASLWTLRPQTVPLALAAAAVVLVASSVIDIAWSLRLMWSVLGAVAVASLLRRFRILALTSEGMVLFDSSSIRQVARSVINRLPADAEIHKLGGNLATSDWSVDGVTYTVTKRGEKELEQMMAHHPGG